MLKVKRVFNKQDLKIKGLRFSTTWSCGSQQRDTASSGAVVIIECGAVKVMPEFWCMAKFQKTKVKSISLRTLAIIRCSLKVLIHLLIVNTLPFLDLYFPSHASKQGMHNETHPILLHLGNIWDSESYIPSTRYVESMLVYCWSTVYDAGPTIN